MVVTVSACQTLDFVCGAAIFENVLGWRDQQLPDGTAPKSLGRDVVSRSGCPGPGRWSASSARSSSEHSVAGSG